MNSNTLNYNNFNLGLCFALHRPVGRVHFCSDTTESTLTVNLTKGHCATSNQLWLEWKKQKQIKTTLNHQMKPFSLVCALCSMYIGVKYNCIHAKQRKLFEFYDTNWLCFCVFAFFCFHFSFIYLFFSRSRFDWWDVFECIWICGLQP